MPLAIRCPKCNALLKAPDAAAGRTLSCPGCKTKVTFPTAAPRPEARPAQKPALVPAPAGDLISVDDMPPLLDAPSPPVAPAKKPEPPRPAPPPVIPNLTLPDDMPALLGDAPTLPPSIPNMTLPEDKTRRPPAAPPEDLYGDFEIVDDDEPIESEVHESAIQEVAAVEEVEEVHEVEEVEEVHEVEEVEEVHEVEDRGSREDDDVDEVYRESRLLALPLIHVKGRGDSLAGGIVRNFTKEDHAEYDLYDPDRRKKVGEAREVRSSSEQLVRFFTSRNMASTTVEITEGRDNLLLGAIRRPPYLWKSSLEIVDCDERTLAVFERAPFQAMTGATVWLKTRKGKKLLQIQTRFWEGKMLFMTREGEKVGEMMNEAAYERRMKIYWNPRGGSYYFSFKKALDDRPLDKLLFICGGLGLDLFEQE